VLNHLNLLKFVVPGII